MLASFLVQVSDNVGNAFLSQGVVGLVALLAITIAYALYKEQKVAHERERQRADANDKELKELYKALNEKYVVALNEATRAVASALRQLEGK